MPGGSDGRWAIVVVVVYSPKGPKPKVKREWASWQNSPVDVARGDRASCDFENARERVSEFESSELELDGWRCAWKRVVPAAAAGHKQEAFWRRERDWLGFCLAMVLCLCVISINKDNNNTPQHIRAQYIRVYHSQIGKSVRKLTYSLLYSLMNQKVGLSCKKKNPIKSCYQDL